MLTCAAKTAAASTRLYGMPHVHLITSFIRYLLCYVMGRFGHENGPFWMLAGANLVLFFLPLGPYWSGPFWFAWAVFDLPLGPYWSGPFWFAWAVFDLHWGRFGDGPFWSVPVQGPIASPHSWGLPSPPLSSPLFLSPHFPSSPPLHFFPAPSF